MQKFTVILTSSSLLLSLAGCAEKVGRTVPEISASSGTPEQERNVQAEPITLRLAKTGSPLQADYQAYIDSFNEADNGYVIELVDYTGSLEFIPGTYSDYTPVELRPVTDESREAMNIQVTQDIINGKIDMADSTLSSFTKLMNKDAFADLYSFMESDPEVNTETLNSHVLELLETDGRLCQLPLFYCISSLVGWERYTGDKENWTLDELIQRWEQMPEDRSIAGHTDKQYVYMATLRSELSAFVDYEKAQVHFNTPEFIHLLEFCNSFSNTTEWSKSDYYSPSTKLCEEVLLCGFRSYHYDVFSEDGDNRVFVGYPSEDGRGAFIDPGIRLAINAASSPESQKGAWQFIRTFADYAYQYDNYIEYDQEHDTYGSELGFPINLRAFDDWAENAENGTYYKEVQDFGDNEVKTGCFTKEEYDRLTEYISGVRAVLVTDTSLMFDIIQPEINRYFNGEQTAQECAEMIQNRAAIYISEQYQ